MKEALTVTLVSWLIHIIDSCVGWQTMMRPIMCASLTGLVCGDVKTGVIMGAELEAIYMGVSGIGGVVPADAKTSSVICTALTILSGINMEAGLALAVPIGTITAQFGAPMRVISDALNDLWMNAARSGNDRLYTAYCYIWRLLIEPLPTQLAIYLSIAFGAEGVQNAVAACPKFILSGMSAAGNIMAVVGLAITGLSIWSSDTWVYLFAGFIFAKFLKLTSLQIALAGFVICYLTFRNELRWRKVNDGPKTVEGDADFYG